MTQRQFPHHRTEKAESRPYRFVRLDAGRLPAEEFTLLCPSDDDALAVGRHLGSGIEVWDGARCVSHDADKAPNAIDPPSLLAPSSAIDPAIHADVRGPAGPRAFNPFRRDAWRRR